MAALSHNTLYKSFNAKIHVRNQSQHKGYPKGNSVLALLFIPASNMVDSSQNPHILCIVCTVQVEKARQIV